jgi:hypothetical protein
MARITLDDVVLGVKEGFEGAGAATRRMKEDERIVQRDQMDAERHKMATETHGLNTQLTQAQLNRVKDEEEAQAEFLKAQEEIASLRGSAAGPFAQLLPPEAQQMLASQQRPGIAPPGEAQPQEPKNPFMRPGDKLYGQNLKAADDIEHQMTAAALTRYYQRMRQPEKAMAVPEVMAAMREKGVSRMASTAAAGLMQGAPGSVDMLGRLWETLGLGSVSGGEFKDGIWRGITVTGADGKPRKMDLDNVAIMQIAETGGNPASALKFMVEQGWKGKEVELRGREVTAKETTADAARRNADANAVRAAAARDTANDGRQDQQAAARAQALGRMFPVANRELKMEETIGMNNEQLATARRNREIDTIGFNYAQNISGLNPRVPVQVIGSFAREVAMAHAGAKNTTFQRDQDPDGRPFVNWGGTKIYLN